MKYVKKQQYSYTLKLTLAVGICITLLIATYSPAITAQKTSSDKTTNQSLQPLGNKEEQSAYLSNQQNSGRMDPEGDHPLSQTTLSDIIIASKEKGTLFAPGEIIVQFQPSVGMLAKTIFAEKRKFSETTGNSNLDDLNEKYTVTSIERVCKTLEQQAQVEGKELLTNTEFFAQLQAQYPMRAQRAPSTVSVPDLENIYLITFDETHDVSQVVAAYENDPSVVYAEPNWKMHLDLTPNDQYYSSSGAWGQDYPDLYGLHLIQSGNAWNVTTGSNDIIVAVIDTGVDYTHEDIHDNMWVNPDEIPENGIDDDSDGFVDNIYGADFYTDDGNPMDGFGHGTHCAGTIAAVGNNTIGVVGVNWHTKIMAIKMGSEDGQLADTDTIVNAIVWATAQGADVFSMSWGGFAIPESLNQALQNAYAEGVVLIASAGNGGNQAYNYPAACENVLSVAAIDWNDQKAGFSTYGNWVDVSAPGVNILSIRANGTDMYGDGGSHVINETYYRASGTSMACPHVSGLAALILSLNPSFSNDFVVNRILDTADNIDSLNPGYEGLLGSGRINASRAVHIYQHNVGLESFQVSDPSMQSPRLLYVNATVTNTGLQDESNVCVSFRVNGIEQGKLVLPFVESFTTQPVSFLWTPPSLGEYVITMNISLQVIEDYYGDNEGTETVIVGVYNSETHRCFSTIQGAINDPQTMNGHHILVPSGLYPGRLIISKDLSLIGEDKETTILQSTNTAVSLVNTLSVASVISIRNRAAVNITKFTIKNGCYGISILSSSNIFINDIILCDNRQAGILVHFSHNVTLTSNELQHTMYGISIAGASHNIIIHENEIHDNTIGLYIDSSSSGSLIYHNNFNNDQNALDTSMGNQWNNTYFDESGLRHLGGNYWSDYTGTDSYSGPSQNRSDPDGIGDTPYSIPGVENYDQYPLMHPYTGPLPVTLFVDDDAEPGGDGTREHPYQHIQDGITNAIGEGDKIYVLNGLYQESPILNHKDVSLIGDQRENTVINGTVTINDGNVTVCNFTITSTHRGIAIFSDGARILRNILLGSMSGQEGISTEYASNLTIQDNIVRGFQFGMLIGYDFINNQIINNTLEENSVFGICIAPAFGGSAYNTTILGNTFIDGGSSANIQIEPLFSASITRTRISDNTIMMSYNENGIVILPVISSSDDMMISNNTIVHTGLHGYSGIIIDVEDSAVCTNNYILRNTITGFEGLHQQGGYYYNGSGILIGDWSGAGYPTGAIISENTLSSNEHGINTRGNTINLIYHNNFLNNTFNAYDGNGDSWWDNGSDGGNYWSDYTGNDTNGDGYGDTPYVLSSGNAVDYYPLITPYLTLQADAHGPYKALRNTPVQFTGSVTGNFPPYTWYWEFGDGNTSMEQNPVHLYTTVGIYTVTLTVTDNHGQIDTDETTATIQYVLADAHGPYLGIINKPVQFTGSAEGEFPPFTYQWNFGDGNSSTEQNPMVSYSAIGTYVVMLTVIDYNGNTDIDTTTATIVEQLVVDTHGPYSGFINEPVQFMSNTSGGFPPYSYLWEFNDPEHHTSTDQNPTFAYYEPGIYTISLTVIDQYENSMMNNTFATIYIRPSVVWVDDDFTNETPGFGDDHFAHVQDGINRVAPNGTVYVAQGTYTDSISVNKPLALLGENQGNTIINAGYVTITASSITIQGFTLQGYSSMSLSSSRDNLINENTLSSRQGGYTLSLSSVENTTVTGNTIIYAYYGHGVYLSSSSGNIIWNNIIHGSGVPNPHPWNYADYGVSLTSSSNSNLITENTIYRCVYMVDIDSTSNNNQLYHNNLGLSTYDHGVNIWDNGYLSGGNYWSGWDGGEYGIHDGHQGENQDQFGSDGILDQGPPSGGLNEYHIYGGSNQDQYPLSGPRSLLRADAQGPYLEQIINIPVQFTGSASGGHLPYISWFWEFGDGAISTEQNPQHPYDEVGTYIVMLTVTDSQGYVETNVTNATVKQFLAEAHGPYECMITTSVQFIGSIIGDGVAPYTWFWEFGDGNTSGEQNPLYLYNAVGIYDVTLTVTDSQGSTDYDTTNVTIRAGLTAEAYGPYVGVINIPVQFTGDAFDGIPPYTYHWELGDSECHTSEEQNPLFAYNATGDYTVNLTVTDSQGNRCTDATIVTIQLLLADTHGPYSGVIEEPVQFTGSVLGGTPEYTWFWEFGNGNTSTEQNPMITFHEETTYTVTLTVTDSEGNYDTKDTTVSIYPSGGTWGGDNNP